MSDYTLGIKELDNGIAGIRKGSNIMMIGPPMCGKEFVLNYIMYQGAAINGNAVTTVTTRESAVHILEWFREQKLDLPLGNIGIIDCVSKTLGYTAPDNENIKIASSPVDLTGIGVKISLFFEEFSRKKKYSENSTSYQFDFYNFDVFKYSNGFQVPPCFYRTHKINRRYRDISN